MCSSDLTVTIDRNRPLAREDMAFITAEHPMVLSAMDLVLSSETGNAAVSVVKHPQIQGGQYLLELLFVVECSAPANLQIGRFLPHTPIRILLDQQQRNLSHTVSHDSLIETGDNFEKTQISQFLHSQRPIVNQLIKQGEQLAGMQMQTLVAEAAQRMLTVMSGEIKRLARLQKVNPGVKPLELEQLKEMTLLCHEHIQDAQLRLDAIRLVIAG